MSSLHDTRRIGSVPMSRGSVEAGALAAVAMAVVYALVVGLASESLRHLLDQASTDGWLLLFVFVGFGVQVALLVELRRQHRLRAAAATAGRVSAGASVTGMVACCAHHVADLLPFLGVTGLAAFLYDYRLVFVLLGVGINAIAIAIGWRRLRRVASENRGLAACAGT